jgi:signal peptidase I
MPRVHELAKELGVSSREVMDRLDLLGYPVSSHASSIGDPAAAEVRREFANGYGADGGEPTSAIDLAIEDQDEVEERGTDDHDTKKRKSLGAHLAEVPLLVLFAFIIAIIIKTFLVQAFYIPSGSMLPTLQIGDRVLVEKISYRFHEPRRGDIVVFAREVFGEPPELPWTEDVRNGFRELLGLPVGSEEDYIKRVVAVGGDRVRYSGTPRQLYINGDVVPQPFIEGGQDPSSPSLTGADCQRLKMAKDGGSCVVPTGMVFVMGDNRGNSEDSRIIGPIDEDKIVGHAFVIIWPFSDMGGL